MTIFCYMCMLCLNIITLVLVGVAVIKIFDISERLKGNQGDIPDEFGERIDKMKNQIRKIIP